MGVMKMMQLDRTQSVNNTLPSQIELEHIMNDLKNKWKCLKLKMMAVKNIRLAQRNHARGQQSEPSKPKKNKSLFGKLFSGIIDDDKQKQKEDAEEEKDENKFDVDENPLVPNSHLFQKIKELTVDSNTSLIHKASFCQILRLILSAICQYGGDWNTKSRICSNTLCDYLSLIDDEENVVHKSNHRYHLDYGSCLLDLIVRHTKVVGMDIGKNLQWNDIAKLQLVRRLLSLCEHDSHGNVVKLINGAIFMYNKRDCGWDHDLNTLIVRAFEEQHHSKLFD